MSEAADELARFAEEFWKKSTWHESRAPKFTESAVAHRQWLRAYEMLRDRADYLRAQERAALVGLPKPDRLDVGQWWMCRGDNGVIGYPGKILRVDKSWADAQTERVGRWSVTNHDTLLTDDRWLYLGDGPEPAQNA